MSSWIEFRREQGGSMKDCSAKWQRLSEDEKQAYATNKKHSTKKASTKKTSTKKSSTKKASTKKASTKKASTKKASTKKTTTKKPTTKKPSSGKGTDMPEFPRKHMTVLPNNGANSSIYRAEGYWRDKKSGDDEFDEYGDENKNRNFPWPETHENPWPGKEIFTKKLEAIESLAATNSRKYNYDTKEMTYSRPNVPVSAHVYKGYSSSRITGASAGSSEYVDREKNICWPEAFLYHYVEQHNVVPTKEFYDYVMNFAVKKY
jgi:hypothetical protein